MRDKEMKRGQGSRKQHTRSDEEISKGAESSLQVEANKERWRDELEAESSLHGRLVASKQRLTDDEGAEELTSRDGEIRRGQRAAYMRKLRQARRDREMRRGRRSREEPTRRDGEVRRGQRAAYMRD